MQPGSRTRSRRNGHGRNRERGCRSRGNGEIPSRLPPVQSPRRRHPEAPARWQDASVRCDSAACLRGGDGARRRCAVRRTSRVLPSGHRRRWQAWQSGSGDRDATLYAHPAIETITTAGCKGRLRDPRPDVQRSSFRWLSMTDLGRLPPPASALRQLTPPAPPKRSVSPRPPPAAGARRW